MYLYSENNNKIEVYSMNPNRNKIYEFKKEQMESIPLDQRILMAVTNNKSILEEDRSEYKYNEIFCQNRGKINKAYHSLIPYQLTSVEIDRQKMLLEEYYQNCYTNKKLVKIIVQEKLEFFKYLLLSKKFYIYENKKINIRTLDNILNLNRDLYLLELLLREDIENIKEEDISKQVSLFDISDEPIASIDLEMFKTSDRYNLTFGLEDEVSKKVNESQKILKHVK